MMKTLPRLLLGLSLVAAIATVPMATVHAAADEDLGAFYKSIVTPEMLSPDDVEEVVALSLVRRGWEVVRKGESSVTGYINHRGREATATFAVGSGIIEIYCNGYVVRKDGTRVKPDVPVGWLVNLEKDIKARLAEKAVLK
jgi:hypothetical protein